VRPALYLVGAIVELLGIVLVASPDLVPGAVAFAGRLRAWARMIESRLRSFLHLPPRVRVASLDVTVTGKGRVGGSLVVGFNEKASLEEKVAWLLRRDRESQEAHNALAARVEAFEEETLRRLEQLRGELKEDIEARLSSRLADLRAARLWGVAALIIGLGLGTVANLL